MAPSSTRKVPRSRAAKKPQSSNSRKCSEFELPYFAHQQLNPTQYHPDVGLPVGKPGWSPAPMGTETATNGDWESDHDAPLEEDPDVDTDVESSEARHNKRHRPRPTEGNPYKRLKVAGGRPAIAKKVTADLDSDDELIVRMKNAKYLEKDIAQRLADEGRVSYHPKTIGTRWARLRKVLEQRQDELLDAELTDWHDGDDEVLVAAVQKADELVAKAKADIDKKKWKIVADQMKSMKPVVSFSQNACHDRYLDLQAGTAKPTPESLEFPDEEAYKRIQSRREKERMIDEDQNMFATPLTSQANIKGNGWTSRTSKLL